VTPEDLFVERLCRSLPPDGRVVLGPGDDAALVRCDAGEIVVTTDMLVEGEDFLPGEEPRRLGRRALAVNLSDLAAMGARPDFFLLTIGFPLERGEAYPLEIARGALSRADPFGASLVGGDLSGSPATIVSVALWGRPAGRPLRRAGGRPGDLLFLSGWPGRAAAGLRLAVAAARRESAPPRGPGPALAPEHEKELLAAYHDPEPRVSLGLALAAGGLASAAIDVSDGLGLDASRLARASGARAVIETEKVPISPALAAAAREMREDALELALSGGDDYELLFSAPPETLALLEAGDSGWGVPVSRIGRLEPGEGAVAVGPSGTRDIATSGWDHFRRRA